MNVKNTKKPGRRSVGRPSEAHSVNSKEQIIKAYLEICFFDGIETVTLQKVAERSGVGLTTVRYHFQGLSLSKVALDYVSDKTYEYLDGGMLRARAEPDFNPVLAYIHVQFNWIEAHRLQATFLVYYYYLCSGQMPLAMANKELIEIAHRRILGLIHEGLGMKLYPFTGDTKRLSQQIHLLVMGACMNAITSRDPEFAQTQKEICVQTVLQLLGAAD